MPLPQGCSERKSLFVLYDACRKCWELLTSLIGVGNVCQASAVVLTWYQIAQAFMMSAFCTTELGPLQLGLAIAQAFALGKPWWSWGKRLNSGEQHAWDYQVLEISMAPKRCPCLLVHQQKTMHLLCQSFSVPHMSMYTCMCTHALYNLVCTERKHTWTERWSLSQGRSQPLPANCQFDFVG